MQVTLLDIVLVMLGGGLGALSRFGVEHMSVFQVPGYFRTAATIFINVTGCLVIGILYACFQHWNVSRQWYLLCITGFLGGYTTYSAFTLDAMHMVQDGAWGTAALYVCVTLVGGLGGCALGMFVTERLLKG